MHRVVLKPGKEKSLLRRHPWVFSGAIARADESIAPGETVQVHAADGRFLALAAWSAQSQIRGRVWSFDETEQVDPAFFARRLRKALQRRPARQPGAAMRLIHGESDDIPGLIIDRYADTLVAQFLSAGTEKWRDVIADALIDITGLKDLYERSDADVRQLEGLPPRSGPLRGAPAASVVIQEHGIRLTVDIERGHKTGFYLDQSENRRIVRNLATTRSGIEALNCFCYTGAFSMSLLQGGASHVLSIDSSGPALDIARKNMAANDFEAGRAEWREADVFSTLRELRDAGRAFDLIILDPPKFAPTPASVDRAARAYKDINLLAFKLLRMGGLLATFSCSGGVPAELFQSIVAGAAADAQVDAKIIERFGAAADHPVALQFPEGDYLKGLLLVRA